jgi:guanylate kinase
MISERDIKNNNDAFTNQLQKLEEEIAQAKLTFITQKDYQEILDKVDKSSNQYNSSIKEINQMIDKMNNSLEVIDSNLVETVSQNYTTLNSKYDQCHTVSDSNNTLIQELRDELEKIKETITQNNNVISENEKAITDQSKITEDIQETLEKLKEINDLKLSKKEHQEVTSKMENDNQAILSMYKQLRQDHKDQENTLQSKIKNLEEICEANNTNYMTTMNQLKSEMNDNIHQMNEQLNYINSFIDEHKEKQKKLEVVEVTQKDFDLPPNNTYKQELEILQDKLEKLPSEDVVQTLVNKSLQTVKEGHIQLENEIEEIKKALHSYSIQSIYDNGNNNNNNNNSDDKTINENTKSTTELSIYPNSNHSRTSTVREHEINNNNNNNISQMRKNYRRERELKREMDESSNSILTAVPATVMSTRELVMPGNNNHLSRYDVNYSNLYYNYNKSFDSQYDHPSIQTLTIKEGNDEKENLRQERLEKERLEKERLEKERLEKEKLEKERIEKERLEKERLEKERLEKERLEKERLEKERLENERLDKERSEKLKLEKEKLIKEY